MLGCGEPAGESGYHLARVVAVLAGMDHLPGTTVNRYCSSSLQSTRMAFHAIKASEGEVFISTGVETVSRFTKGNADGLPDTQSPVFDVAQRRTEKLAAGGQLTGTTRADHDAFGVRSQSLAAKAVADGFWERDITPVTLPDGTLVSKDDGPRAGVTLKSLAQVQPVFRPDGTVTAGNCCLLNDGAAALVIMSDTKDSASPPLARIGSTGVSGLSPEIMGLGPVEASKQALGRAGLTIDDIDLVEINSAFAAQVITSERQLGVDDDKLNVNGGAIAVGHPFGDARRPDHQHADQLAFHCRAGDSSWACRSEATAVPGVGTARAMRALVSF